MHLIGSCCIVLGFQNEGVEGYETGTQPAESEKDESEGIPVDKNSQAVACSHDGCFCWDERGICRWIQVNGQTASAFTLRI